MKIKKSEIKKIIIEQLSYDVLQYYFDGQGEKEFDNITVEASSPGEAVRIAHAKLRRSGAHDYTIGKNIYFPNGKLKKRK